MATTVAPLALPANQPSQFYRGGHSIAELRGAAETEKFGPEDWVASTTSRFGQVDAGQSRLPGGQWLRDAVQQRPQDWLGADHVATFGDSTALLVKLLDAGQRLPVHCHPSDRFAQQHLGSRFGKTEAWVVVNTAGTNPVVYLGFREDVDSGTVARWVSDQDSSTMLGALNRIPVQPGDTVHVPAGTPHAIGAGVFLVELQQPTDLSITLEWDGFLTDAEAAFLGMEQETALHTLNRSGLNDAALAELITRTGGRSGPRVPLLAEAAAPFFRAERLQPGRGIDLDPSFGVLIALDGSGRLDSDDSSLPLHRGETVVVPHATGPVRLSGDCTLVHCRPPAARA